MLSNIGGPTLIVILFIVLLLFGAPKLPALARSLGQSMKILKKEVSPEEKAEAAKAESAAAEPEAARVEPVKVEPATSEAAGDDAK